MAQMLYRLGRLTYLNRWKTLVVWLLLIAGMAAAAANLSQPLSNNFTIPGLESIEAQDEIKERFNTSDDALTAPTAKVIVQAPEGKTLEDSDVSADVDKLVTGLKDSGKLKDTDELVNPVMAAMGMKQQLTGQKAAQGIPQEQIDADLKAISPLSEDRRTGTIDITFDAEKAADVTSEQRNAITTIISNDNGNLTTAYSGNAFQDSESLGMQSELIGITVAAVVLIITFGSLVAAGLPLLTAVVGVAFGLMGVTAATGFTDSINSMTPTLASMIGLAVGIDYALFILSRFRSELIDHINGHDLTPKQLSTRLREISREDRAHLAGLAVGKAGSAVVFAGLTVLIALAALTIVNISFLSAMALAAAATVAVAVLVAITLLPAILGLVGTRVFSVTAPFVTAPDPEQEKPTMGLRWIRQVRSRPLVFLGAGALVLILLAIPAMNLRLSMPTDGVTEPGSPRRVAYEMTEEAFGPGRNSPMIAVVDATSTPEDQRMQSFGAAVEKLQGTDGVSNAQIIALNDAQDTAQVLITPEYGATDERTSDLLHDLRNNADNYKITGVGPMFEDISQRLNDALLPYLAVVLSLAFVLLMLVFRSIWVPLIATLGFALTVAATFGLTVLIWQQGFAGLVSDPQPLISFLPIMLVGIVFGLAMDYQVFLVSRMREGYVHGKTAGNAVANGFKHGARVVTAAALIMISVFAAFMLIDEKFIVVMGFALAVAVFFDAFIVRMTIIPATMFLLDDRAWRLPRWLDRMIPHVDIEGESLTRKAPVH
ncbi:MMPL family transporter [Corynebacterium durum]|uniref:MMPL family transporter n=1 Tax=Corynebacterium durum TaxID=61592 RepID=UPI00288AEFFF|nr:MMPL family transporter [Corynebacterium durum]